MRWGLCYTTKSEMWSATHCDQGAEGRQRGSNRGLICGETKRLSCTPISPEKGQRKKERETTHCTTTTEEEEDVMSVEQVDIWLYNYPTLIGSDPRVLTRGVYKYQQYQQ